MVNALYRYVFQGGRFEEILDRFPLVVYPESSAVKISQLGIHRMLMDDLYVHQVGKVLVYAGRRVLHELLGVDQRLIKLWLFIAFGI